MSYQFYLFLHVLAVSVVFISLGGIVSHLWQGGTKTNLKNRKPLSIYHGVALLVVFVSGFGLMAKGAFSFGSSPWLYIKIVSWLLLGVFPVAMYKKLIPAKWGVLALMCIAMLAIYTVVYKPI